MEYKNFIFTKENGIAIVQLNRPEVLNAINDELLSEMIPALEDIATDDNVRVLLVKGSQNVFAAGADIKSVVNYTPYDAHKYIDLVQICMNKFANLKKPSIASIAGYALGGGFEMAMACDIRIAADNAIFGLPEINLGIIPGGSGTQKLSRLIGEARAKELILLGSIFDANKALEYGLINKLVTLDKLDETSMKFANKLCKKPPIAIRAAKELITLSSDVDIFTGLMMEKEKFAYLFSTQDQKEGMNAFLEGRKANFIGK